MNGGSEVSTSCRFCEFKVADENGNQTGCELDLLHLFQSKGIETAEREHDDENGKNTAFEPKTFCMFLRPSGWKKAMADQLKDGVTYKNIARNEMAIKATLMVYVPKDSTMEQIQKFTNHVNLMKIKPETILFMNFSDVMPATFRKLSSKVAWRHEFMTDNKKSKEAARDFGFDLGSKKVKTPYLVQMDLDQEIRLDYLAVIEREFFDNAERFICVTNEIGKPAFYYKSVYRYLRGNEQASIDEKIELLTEEQECPKMIRTYQQVFQK